MIEAGVIVLSVKIDAVCHENANEVKDLEKSSFLTARPFRADWCAWLGIPDAREVRGLRY